jgi:2-polyprenyl-3-methyl-5-hydroxy-6-metoxy-1,4-benzoquinol methylase
MELAEKLQKKLGRSIKIMDVGCGVGNMSIPLASQGNEVLGIDIDTPTILKARELNPFTNALFEVRTIDDVSKSKYFDLILCCEIIEHLNDPDSFLASVVSHLKNSGILVISIPNGYGPYEVVELFKHNLVKIIRSTKLEDAFKRIFYQYMIPAQRISIDRDIESPHVAHYTLKRFFKLVSKHGLKISLMKNTNFISGIFPLNTIQSKKFPIKTKFEYWDCTLSERMPGWMASGWYFELTKIN